MLVPRSGGRSCPPGLVGAHQESIEGLALERTFLWTPSNGLHFQILLIDFQT